jgi:hypothetical protein
MKVIGLLEAGQEVFWAPADRESREIRLTSAQSRIFRYMLSLSKVFLSYLSILAEGAFLRVIPDKKPYFL